jgi:hypothetical protein
MQLMIRMALAVLMLAAPGALGGVARAADPTPEEYVAHVGGDAVIVASGELVIAGRRMWCGRRPTVLDNNLDDYAAAYPGFLIVNPTKMTTVPPAVAMWIFSHECGHQFRGPEEEAADCFAAQRGRRQKWLDEDGIEQICHFILPASGDAMHFAGPQRCEIVRRCFADPEVR